MKFTKMHGIGNDYIYINCFSEKVENPERLAVFMSKYHFGIGADGIVLICPSDNCDFRMRMFNADGSEGKMCGNAVRCIGKYVYEKGLTDKTKISLETKSGVKTLDLFVEDGCVKEVSVDMGKADFLCKNIPVVFDGEKMIGENIVIGGHKVSATCVSMGNPHCVIFGDDPEELELSKIGPDFENDPIFPERVNTEFVKVIDKNTLKMRVWERGSGETLACGTGACAVTAAAVLNGICEPDTEVTVKLVGGDLKITYKSTGYVTMRGPASFVFDGEISQEVLKNA